MNGLIRELGVPSTTLYGHVEEAASGGDDGKGRQSIDRYIGTLVHTEHCEKMLLGDRQITWDEFNTRIKVKYPDCGV